MANVFSKNAYNVLALETNATIRECNRRAREILQLSKIGETCVDGDLGLIVPDRTEPAVNEALSDLSSPKKALKASFFWFDNMDTHDQEALDLIRANKINDAIQLWAANSSAETISATLKKKNLSILYTIELLRGNHNHLEPSLSLWKALHESDKFWKNYVILFQSNRDEEIDAALLNQFRASVPSLLADAYEEASESNTEIFAKFRRVFKTKGLGVEKKIYGPAINVISLEIEKLNNMNISGDNVFSKDEAVAVTNSIKKIQEQFNVLMDYDFYNDGEIMVLRDNAANAIRGVVLDLHNQLGETDKAVRLIRIAGAITGTKSLQNKLSKDIETLESMNVGKQLLSKIDKMIDSEDYTTAVKQIQSDQKKFSDDVDMQSALKDRLKAAVALYVMNLSNSGFASLNNKDLDRAAEFFGCIDSWAAKYIGIYDIEKATFSSYLAEAESSARQIKLNNITSIDILRQRAREVVEKNFSKTFEGMFVIGAVDGKVMPRAVTLLKKQKTVSLLYSIGWFTLLIYGLGIVFFIAGWIYKNME